MRHPFASERDASNPARPIRWLHAALTAIMFLLGVGVSSSASAQVTPDYPVIFVHGLNSSARTWQDMIASSDNTGALTGGRLQRNPVVGQFEIKQ